ncbi:MAG: CRTAC1 family protein [Myxococcota bacterium]|nr:CRTAC1 family protein [Myxococcota bacterium]
MRQALPSFVVLVALAAGCSAPALEHDAGADAGAAPDSGPEGRHWFDDVTLAAGVDAVRPDDFTNLPQRMNGGVCVLDVDGTAPMDLFFAMMDGDGARSRLYVAGAPLDFEDRTSALGLDAVGGAMGCLAFDAEGDGDDDLLVTGVGQVRLFVRDGDGFVERTEALGLSLDPLDMYVGAAAGDVDDDGDLDLLVAGMIHWDEGVLPADCGRTCGGQLHPYTPIANLLLRREADGTYREVAAELAPALALAEPTQVVAITDLDGDGRVDLYVGNDLGATYPNRPLVRDAGGVYRDVGIDLGLSHNARGYGMDSMGFSTADIDGDGQLDHVVTSLQEDATAVFLCADGFCEPQPPERSGTQALSDSFRWGAALVDLDLDGRPDLVEAAGHIHVEEIAELIGQSRDQMPNVMWNAGGRFEPIGASAEDGRRPSSARGIAVTDLDEDGRPDIVLGATVGRPYLLRNVVPPRGDWLRVRLVGRAPNTGGVGARVTVRDAAGAAVGIRDRRAGEGYLGSFDPRLFFGVVSAGPFTIDVRWPSGESTSAAGIAPGSEVELRE